MPLQDYPGFVILTPTLYQSSAQSTPTDLFTMGGETGVNLHIALYGKLDYLDGRYDQFYGLCGTKVTQRILVWLPYSLPFKRCSG